MTFSVIYLFIFIPFYLSIFIENINEERFAMYLCFFWEIDNCNTQMYHIVVPKEFDKFNKFKMQFQSGKTQILLRFLRID